MQVTRRLTSSLRRIRPSVVVMVVAMVIIILILAYNCSARDYLLVGIIPPWTKGVSTWNLFRMHFGSAFFVPANMTSELLTPCERELYPQILDDKHKMAESHVNGENNHQWNFSGKILRHDHHEKFMPVLSPHEKREMIQAFKIVSTALREAGVPLFLVAGSLLGAYRHRGMIPWDDDLDIALSVKDWDAVRQALSCIPGYGLFSHRKAHWKFYKKTVTHTTTPNDNVHGTARYTISPKHISHHAHISTSNEKTKPHSHHSHKVPFPYIDLFFYVEDDEYIWAGTPYLLESILFRRDDVFPLSEQMYEGIPTPVPRNAKQLLEQCFDTNLCSSPSIDHRKHSCIDSVKVPCSELVYLYPMFNLDGHGE